ncbi:MAG: hypothetical protein Q7J74_05185 [Pseudomonas sp.]|nr:hypothetical protein [Pseudomonas sp.]
MTELNLQTACEGSVPNLVEAYERYELSHQDKAGQHASKAYKHD